MESILEIFADFSSPSCYFMLPNIEKLKNKYNIKLKWRAYLLKGEVAAEGESFKTEELIEENEFALENKAKEQNLPWTNNRARRFQTQSAHIIAKWADENNIGDVFRQTVFYYYFVLQKNIAMQEVLKEIIIKTGFYEIKPKDILNNKKYLEMFEEDLKRGNKIEVKELPSIIYNDKIISGFVKMEKMEKFFARGIINQFDNEMKKF